MRLTKNHGRAFSPMNPESNINSQILFLQQAIDHLDQGFSVFSSDLKLIAWNKRFYELLEFPESLCRYGVGMEKMFRFNAERGEYGEGDINEQIEQRMILARRKEQHCFERVRPDGTTVEIQGKPMPDGSFVTIYTDITERKRIEKIKQELFEELELRVEERTKELSKREQELKEKTRLLEITLDNISQGISLVNKDLKVRVINRKLVEILDMPERFLEVGTSFEAFMRYNAERGEYGPGDIDKLVEERMELARNVTPHLVKRKRPDGTVVEISGQPLPEGGFVTTYTDITEKEHALQHLEESEQQLRAILDNAPAIIYLKAVNGTYLTVNDLYESLFHIDQATIVGKTDYDLFPKKMADRFRENDQQVLERNAAIQFEEQAILEDGIHDYISVKFPLANETGEPYAICGISTDITERNRSQAELNRLQRYLKNVVDSMPSAIIGIDAEQVVTQWNREAESLSGVSEKDALGQKINELALDILPTPEILRSTINTFQPSIHHKQITGKDSAPMSLEITIFPLDDFEVNGTVIRIDDVSERIRLQEMMIQSEKMLSVGGLAAGMAHEINNPLAGILQNIQVLQNRLNPALPKNRKAAKAVDIDLEKVNEYLNLRQVHNMAESIRESGERAARIVENMLSFSRKENSKHQPHDLKSLIEKTIELAANDFDLKKRYDFRQISIQRDYQPNLPPAICSPSKIQQVILNLLKNSAEAMSTMDQEAEKQIHIDLKRTDKQLKLTIQDNGPGMNQETRKRIFEPFYTTKDVGVGTGLGLSISYFIITQDHHGEMQVDSSPGQGARFTILLNSQGV